MVNFLLKKFPGELENLCFFFLPINLWFKSDLEPDPSHTSEPEIGISIWFGRLEGWSLNRSCLVCLGIQP